ncbi:hypothetical protein OIU76_026235 [Salix suchowensis]|nr:hypothetical protein OIU76_026235 [Salix suchowensis]
MRMVLFHRALKEEKSSCDVIPRSSYRNKSFTGNGKVCVTKEDKAYNKDEEALFTAVSKPLFFTKKRVFLKSGRWWPGLGLNHNYDCGLEQTPMGRSLHCLFLPSKRKLASKSVMEALVRVPQILARVPQNLLPLSFWTDRVVLPCKQVYSSFLFV